MADNKKSFLLYADLIHTVKKLPDENAGILFKLILEYVNDLSPNIDSYDLLTQVTFEPIKLQLKRDLKRWEEKQIQRIEAGKRSAESRRAKLSESQETERPLTTVEHPSTVNVTVTDTVNVTEYTLVFDEFRNLYQGTKRGNETEFENFKKKHKDWKDVLPKLKQSVLNQISDREKKKKDGKFVPEWKNLQTWINQRCWEEVVDIEPITQQPPIRKRYQRIEP